MGIPDRRSAGFPHCYYSRYWIVVRVLRLAVRPTTFALGPALRKRFSFPALENFRNSGLDHLAGFGLSPHRVPITTRKPQGEHLFFRVEKRDGALFVFGKIVQRLTTNCSRIRYRTFLYGRTTKILRLQSSIGRSFGTGKHSDTSSRIWFRQGEHLVLEAHS